ncbi:YggT family protein [Algibacillus agarilyticus]|uniref:YggT family protein n=1 Tax=Algibacillus agarilyticus TaxID=2234133 RepID=UPI000DCFEE03|nr:YggT family protein [Algibacillus agarilyticus]
MNATYFLIDTIFGLYLMAVLLRFWLQIARADFYNPFSQFVVKVTNPLLIPLRKVVPGLFGLDMASIVLALLIALLKIVAILLLSTGSIDNPLMLILPSVVIVVKEALNIIFWIMVIRALLSWVSQGQSPMDAVLFQLTEPLLRPIRKVLPSMGGIDLSVLVFLISIQFINLLLVDMFGRI